MKQLLRMAEEQADSAEILVRKTRKVPVLFMDRRMESVAYEDSFNISLRIIRDGSLGTSYGNSLEDRATLVEQAVKSARYGDRVEFDFSDRSIPRKDLGNFDEGLMDFPLEEIARNSLGLVDSLKSAGVETTIEVETILTYRESHFINSKGAEGIARSSHAETGAMVLLPASGVGPIGIHHHYSYALLPDEKRNRMLEEYRAGLKRVSVPTRKMKLMVTPDAWYMIKWRIEKAVSAQSLVEHITPLEGKEGRQVLDERITITDDPHRHGYHRTALFDDEGVPTSVFTIFDRGVFKGFACDLKNAQKLGRRSTGHGWKTTMWGGDIGTPVQPALPHLMFEPGETTLSDMVAAMDEGIVLHFPNSAHSGNIPQGDFSVNIGLGYYVKNGSVQGRVEDCMVSGNIYELFRNLESVSSEREDDRIPYLLFRDVSVSGTAAS